MNSVLIWIPYFLLIARSALPAICSLFQNGNYEDIQVSLTCTNTGDIGPSLAILFI